MAEPADWNALIAEVVDGRWTNPQTGKPAAVPFKAIVLAETLDGREADLVAPLELGRRLAVVSDSRTVEVMGRRVASALRPLAEIDEVVLTGELSCDEDTVALVGERTRHANGLVAVGSGVLNDLCKHATFLDGRSYAVFGTAASMNGYGSPTASLTLRSGLKTSVTSHAPRGVFLDLAVSAAAPTWLSAAGLGDSLCRPTAQADWWAAHRLFGSAYSDVPYQLIGAGEPAMLAHAPGLATHDLAANGHLQRVLTLCALGISLTGTSHAGSMGEHQISHWIDMFAGADHPGTTHGQQVGAASLLMARLQAELLARAEPPTVRPTVVDEAAMRGRYGPALAELCLAELRKTALDADGAAALNRRLAEVWPDLRTEIGAQAIPVAEMAQALRAAGGPLSGEDLGLRRKVWRDAVRCAREIRGRWSFLNLAADAGLLEPFLEEHC